MYTCVYMCMCVCVWCEYDAVVWRANELAPLCVASGFKDVGLCFFFFCLFACAKYDILLFLSIETCTCTENVFAGTFCSSIYSFRMASKDQEWTPSQSATHCTAVKGALGGLCWEGKVQVVSPHSIARARFWFKLLATVKPDCRHAPKSTLPTAKCRTQTGSLWLDYLHKRMQ